MIDDAKRLVLPFEAVPMLRQLPQAQRRASDKLAEGFLQQKRLEAVIAEIERQCPIGCVRGPPLFELDAQVSALGKGENVWTAAISPDGKILARGLRGEAIRKAVGEALR